MISLFSTCGNSLASLAAMFSLTLFLGTAEPASAQNPGSRGNRAGGTAGTVTGTILDARTEESVPGGSVAIWSVADSTLVTGAISRLDGSFTIEGIRRGEYYLKVSALGYEKQIVSDLKIGPGSFRVDLGKLMLQPDSAGLAETVTVTERRSSVEFRSDRTIYNVEDQPINAGGDAMDVLKNVPQLEVDIDDNISLRGSQNVVVLVNGRSISLSGDALAGYLRSLSSEGISKVEVIPNPSAKYDPEGMAGIVNIVLSKDSSNDKVSGNVSLGGSTNNNYNASGSLNWRTNRLTLFGSYSFRYDERESERMFFRENRLLNPITILDQSSTGSSVDRSHVLNTSLEYGLNDKNFLTASAMFHLRSGMDGDRIEYQESTLADEMLSQTLRLSPEDEQRNRSDFSIGYRWTEEAARHEFSAEARYSTNYREDLGTFIEYDQIGSSADSVIERQNNDAEDTNEEWSFQADYVRPVGEKGRFETGYRGEVNRINNMIYSETFDPQVGEFQPDVERNNEFIYDEQIHAVYAIYAQELGRFETQAGLRAEGAVTDFNLVTTGESFENDYFSLFPSASVSYSLDDSRRLRASYSKRIRRPGVRRLNPFTQYEDRLNLRTGNPYLQPEYNHSVEIGFNQIASWGTLSLTPYFRRTTNEIERVLNIDSTGVTRLTFENFNVSDSYGTEFVGTWRAGSWWNGFLNLSVYRIVLDGNNVDAELSNDAVSWSGRVNNTVTIVPGLDVQASYFYRAPVNISGGKIDAMHGADIAVKKSLFGDRASLSLRISDPFNTRKFSLVRDTQEYLVDVTHHRTSQIAWLTFSYDFGADQKDRNRRRTNRGDDDGGSQEIDL